MLYQNYQYACGNCPHESKIFNVFGNKLLYIILSIKNGKLPLSFEDSIWEQYNVCGSYF